MATDIEICSAALSLLGDTPISSFTENTNKARTCAALYPMAKRQLLRDHVWNCAVKRVVLSPLADAPAFGYGRQFTKPGDWLRLLDINCRDDDFQFEGNRILCNATSLQLRYVADVTEGMWDASLTDLMAMKMAARLAYPITKSASLAQLKMAEYGSALTAAKTIDGNENPPEFMGDSPFLQVRDGAGYGWGRYA